MDRIAETGHNDTRKLASNDDFAALFDQLDCPDAGAPIDGGLSRLVHAMQMFKQRQPDFR